MIYATAGVFVGLLSILLLSQQMVFGGVISLFWAMFFMTRSGFSAGFGKPMPAEHLKGGQLLKVIALAQDAPEVIALKYPFGPKDIVCFRYDQKLRPTLQIGYKYIWSGKEFDSVV